MSGGRVLVSGFGIAGAAIAHWLLRSGWEVTVVERAARARSSGAPVDVRGDAVAALREMGCYERLRALSTGVTDVEFVDRMGRRIGGFAMEPSAATGDFEIARHDLARELAAAAAGAEVLWGDEIVEARQSPERIEVTLAGGAVLRSDLLVVADGLHSTLRRLVVGPGEAAVSPLGLWIATVACPIVAGDELTVRVYSEPGRSVAVHPAGGHPGAALMLRDRPGGDMDLRDGRDQRAFLAGAFAGSGWLVPRILDHLAQTEDLYFDAVSRVRLRRWWRGRVVLLGDAASSVTIFGDGSSMAIAGARELAAALDRCGDVGEAFEAYERAQRRRVEPRQRRVQLGSHFLVPSSGPGLTARNLLIRAAGILGRPGASG